MSEISNLFKPETLFSKENPFMKSAEKTHRLFFDAFDRTARLQLSLAEDLLNLNRKRFNALYTDDGVMDKVSAHQDLAVELGKRTAAWAGDLQEVAVDLQNSFSEAANDLVTSTSKKKPATKVKKAKAA